MSHRWSHKPSAEGLRTLEETVFQALKIPKSQSTKARYPCSEALMTLEEHQEAKMPKSRLEYQRVTN
jgi:hypothetical protein